MVGTILKWITGKQGLGVCGLDSSVPGMQLIAGFVSVSEDL
jgi:hypothetical protein